MKDRSIVLLDDRGIIMGKTIGIILAGGIGTRMEADKPKQYLKLCGKEILSYSIEAFRSATTLNDFYIVINDDKETIERVEKQYGVKTIRGGKGRNDSFRNALDYIRTHVSDCDQIFVNEAARPMITPQIIDFYINKLEQYDYVYTAAKITDSLGTVTNRFVDRSKFLLVQSPEAYHFKQIDQYFSASSETTYSGHDLPETFTAYQNFNYRDNFKVTYPEDIALAEFLLQKRSKNKI